MVIRRVTTLACAFCLAVPAAAGASHQPTVGSEGTVSADQETIEAKGPYGVTLAHPPQNTIEAKGPYGVTLAAGPHVATRTKAQRADISRSDDASSWRAVAISEAALLALALGSALLIVRRRRVPRLGA